MGLRVKVVLGLVVFIVIFGLRFLCVNCQQVVADVVVVEDHMQPQVGFSFRGQSFFSVFGLWEFYGSVLVKVLYRHLLLDRESQS